LPSDNDSACYFEPYTGGFSATGYQRGDTVNDFTLFSYNGDTLNLRRELQKGKPVVLISCSYTCPVYRGKVPNINFLRDTYGNSVSIFLIYTIEAHPYPDISPYFGYVNPGQQNINEGILYPLARTYGQRKTLVWKMDSAMTINVPVFIDSPCDVWLRKFGPAPNNAYLITRQGIVFAKHPWYNKPPNNMFRDIDSLLGIGGGGGGGNFNGIFSFLLAGDSTVIGTPGETLYGHGLFINNSNDTAIIRAIRDEEILPAGWSSSICIDVCYPPEADTAIFYFPPSDTQEYTMYFYTNAVAGNGHIKMRFENVNVTSNIVTQNFYASTSSTSINSSHSIVSKYSLYQNYPNPFNPTTKISYGLPKEGFVTLKIYDVLGKEVMTLVNGNMQAGYYDAEFSGNNLASGLYFYKLESGSFIETKRMLLIK